LLQRPDHFLEFRKYVRNIIDWGKDKRLKEIRDLLNSLLEKNRKMASQLAKSRLPPSDNAASISNHRRKDSSSRGHNSRATGVQEYPSGKANAPPSTNFQKSDQDKSLIHTPAADSMHISSYATFPKNNQDESSTQIAPANNRYTSTFLANNQDDSSLHVSTIDNGYTSTDAPITPPQSANDKSLLLKSSEDIDESNVRGHRRGRRTRKRRNFLGYAGYHY
jgi:hypothetical protein